MKEKKSLIIKLICTFSVLLAIFVAVGFSDYVVNGGLNTSDKISEKDNVVENNEKVALSFKYAVAEGMTETTYDEQVIAGRENVKTNDESHYNDFYNFMNTIVVGAPSNGTEIAEKSDAYNYEGKGEYKDCGVLLYVSKTIKKTKIWKLTIYSGQYTLKYKKNNTYTSSVNYYGHEIKERLVFNKNDILDRALLAEKLNLQASGNYKLVGLSEEGTDGFPKETVLSFPIKVTATKTYYALFNKTEMTGVTKYVLGKTISGYTSGEHTFNALAASNELNLTNDASYFKEDNTVFLGDKTSTIVTADGNTIVGSKIASGVTVNFGLNNGDVLIEGKSSSIFDLEPEDSAHVNQYTVCLQSDLYVYGTLVIGSNYGTTQNTDYQGHIAKEYVTFDLNGYNIYLENGTLDIYGLIKNSRETGKIIASGGNIYTLAVIHDYRGGSATSGLVGDKIFPFQVYALPYFRCKAQILDDNSSGWTRVTARCIVKATSYTKPSKIEIKFIGNDTDQVLFKVSKKENSSIEIEGTENKNIMVGKTEASDEVKFCLSRRLKLSFINCSVKMSDIVINPGQKVDTKDFNFPVSSFFDVYLKNTEMTFWQSLKFMPGMSRIADRDSKVILSYDSSAKKAAQISVLGNSAIYQCSEKGKMITTGLVAEAPYYYGRTFFASKALWEYYSGNRIKIYGTLVFKGGNKNCEDYLLAGAIDFNRVAYSSDGTTSALDYIDYSENENPFAKLIQKHTDVSVKTYGYDYLLGDNNRNNVIKGYSRPLVSYGKGYYTNGAAEGAKVGDYSFITGIFKVSDTEMYYFDAGTKFTLSDNSTCNLKACTYDETEHVFIDQASNEKFAYFASSYYPYTNTDGTITLNTIRANDNTAKSVTVKWDYFLGRWLRA